jgi:DNA mismatch endonuclease (patch repair protein)
VPDTVCEAWAVSGGRRATRVDPVGERAAPSAPVPVPVPVPVSRVRPIPSSERVSDQMRRMPRSATGPELALRRALHREGLRFTVNRRDLPGSPDIVLSRARMAVFVDGCFWHRCADHGVLPRSNRDWWAAKLRANVERDRRKDVALVAGGWLPVHLWEHEAVEAGVEQLVALWRERTGRA